MRNILMAVAVLSSQAVHAGDLETTFQRTFTASGLTALGFAAQQGDAPTQVYQAGFTARKSFQNVPDGAAWHIGSITKVFTAVLIMKLVDKDVLTLEMTLAQLLPGHAPMMTPSWQSVTLRELLSHTGGLPANPSPKGMRAAYAGQATGEFLSDLWPTSISKPRGEFHYSNIGYIILGEIIEAFHGVSWEEAVQSEIAGSLGLTSLGVGAPLVVYGHRKTIWGLKPVEPGPHADNPEIFTPAGRLHASVADMMTFGRSLLDACAGKSNVLSQDSCQQMMTPLQEGYGLGLVKFDMLGLGDLWGHNGSNTMWYALLTLDVETDTVAYIVANDARERKVIDAFRKIMGDLNANR